ncbi:hypothetical protein AOQ72_10570 [Bradyrhizobium yuanmingense]|uniref:Uncharacterized protein n=1 Tax=Bradyrhizobium yuanmingense TaxID=108015 RepID=A0A0R3CW85_9BRAD|nr:hypothetical protein [Bradyrhizobium yuanmingense]KRQ01851.1 hypothetical protein AOQ72_10570 [Bradyrhizobium yuanmingense]
MSSQPWQFKPREIRRAIRSVQSAGLQVAQVEIGRSGQIVINVVNQPATPRETAAPSGIAE